ncbi:MFS transporter [Modestobacter excelsi]|uniref:MFS transporter n=1 Tax=Modestobacter excelsi TaxID=2213161 RepID=UPI00110D1AE7|nr:MFS transporter [Modestobacter excelsi]
MNHVVQAQDTSAVIGKPRRRSLSRSVAYALAAYVIGLGFFAAVTPSPLYQSYRALWGFSSLTLTLVYATYAFGVLVTLLFAGSVSDDVGRRPVLLVGLSGLIVSTICFFFASSVAWLFVARGVQGLATGAAISAASAALLDLHPRRDAWGVGLANAVASSAGIALGVLLTSLAVEIGSAPLKPPYVLLFGLLAVGFVGACAMPEPVTNRRRPRLTFQRPHVPAPVRRPFVLAGLTALSSWSLGGLFFSLGPALSARLFDSKNTVLAGIGIVAVGGTAALCQLLLGRTSPWLSACLGSIALVVGVLLVVLATAKASSSLFVIGSAFCGAGFGVGFLGGLRGLVGAIPAQHRASVMAAFYIVAYAAISVPAVLAGLVVGHLGLQSTFEAFGLVIVAISSVTAGWAWATRPAPSGERRRTTRTQSRASTARGSRLRE